MVSIAYRFARRELRSGLQGFRILIACLAVGVATIAAAGSLSRAVETGLSANARVILGGDLEARVSHRAVTADQRAAFTGPDGRLSEAIEMRAMAYAAPATESSGGALGRRTLVELKAVDTAYPLYGDLILSPPAPPGRSVADVLGQGADGSWGAVADPGLLDRLGVRIGDRVTVGAVAFRIEGTIEREPDRVTNIFNFGPRFLVARAAVDATGLLQPGSLVRYIYRVALPPGGDAEAHRAALLAAHPEAEWMLRGPKDAAPGVRNFLDDMALFLTLVGLTALLVGGIGVASAVRAHLDGRTRTIAILKAVGAPARVVFLTYLIQVGIMAAIGIAIGVVVGAAVPMAGLLLLGDVLPVPAEVGLYPRALAAAALFGALSAAVFALWPLAQARDIPPTALFRGPGLVPWRLPRPADLALVGGLALVLAGLVVLAAGEDRRFAGWFVVAAVGALVAFRLAASLIRLGARRLAGWRQGRPGHAGLRLALANLHRPGAPTAGVVLALGLGLTVLVAVGLIESSLDRQVANRLPEQAPAFFFIDIQPDDTETFTAAVRTVPGAGEVRLASMVRGRITRLNGQPVDVANVDPAVRWAVRGDRGLTTAATPPADSRLVAGSWWAADYDGPTLVSLAADVGRGLGLAVGDSVTVNVLGRDMTATVANLRDVDWSSLGMNFSFVFSPGTLEGAPHSYIATVHAPPSAEDAVERAVTDRLPNATAIRVRQALEAVRDIIAKAAAAIRATAAVSLVAGGLVLAGAMAAGRSRRIREAVILKVLGATRRDVLGAYLIEYGSLGLATGVVAAVLGSAASWAVMQGMMHMTWSFSPGVALTIVVVCVALTLVAGFVGTWRALSAEAAPLLRND